MVGIIPSGGPSSSVTAVHSRGLLTLGRTIPLRQESARGRYDRSSRLGMLHRVVYPFCTILCHFLSIVLHNGLVVLYLVVPICDIKPLQFRRRELLSPFLSVAAVQQN